MCFLENFAEPLLRSSRSRGHFRGRGGQIWVFILNFCYFEFRGLLTSVTSATSEGAQGIFSEITFLKSVRSNEKDEVCHSFLVKIFAKSFHRGGVALTLHHSFFNTTLSKIFYRCLLEIVVFGESIQISVYFIDSTVMGILIMKELVGSKLKANSSRFTQGLIAF